MFRKLGLLLALLGGLLLLAAPSAAANGTYLGGDAGYDISWPQCGGPYPALPPGQFGVVGINGGHPFSLNPCFADEYAWASSGGLQPTVYINTDYGELAAGPKRCAADDHACQAYNYGFGAARYSFDAAWDETGGETESVPIWWLDVETENNWSGDAGLNAEVIQGALDYLQLQGRTAGIYSTPLQWTEIAGGFAPDGVAGWVAGGSDGNDFGMCGESLWANAGTIMFQYLIGDFDQNVPC
jgi:hypothetical protein